MKKFLITILFLAIGAPYASAYTIPPFTIRATLSTIRKTIAPQLYSSVLSASRMEDFFIATSSVGVVLSGASSGSTYTDVITDFYNSGSIRSTCGVTVVNGWHTPVFSSLTPSIGTIDQSGVTTYVGDGLAKFKVVIGTRAKMASCPMLQTSNQFSTVLRGFVSSSTLANAIISSAASRINGLTPSGATTNIYSSINDTNHTYIRNTSSLAYAIATTTALDMTAIPAITSGGITGDGVLVAPDIIIDATHVCQSGATFYFVDNSNVTYSRAATGFRTIAANTDICVIKLASDVPASIHPAKVLPSGAFNSYMTGQAASLRGIPVMMTNQGRTIGINTILELDNPATFVNHYTATSSSSVFWPWYYYVHSGDSGNAGWIDLNGQFVALGTHFGGASISNISNNEAAINAAITALGSPYQLTTVDLSGYPTF